MTKRKFYLSLEEHHPSTLRKLFEILWSSQLTYWKYSFTRSSNPSKGKKPEILETKSDTSYEYAKTIRASDEGIYEVVSIKDRFCAFSTQKAHGSPGRKLLMYH